MFRQREVKVTEIITFNSRRNKVMKYITLFLENQKQVERFQTVLSIWIERTQTQPPDRFCHL